MVSRFGSGRLVAVAEVAMAASVAAPAAVLAVRVVVGERIRGRLLFLAKDVVGLWAADKIPALKLFIFSSFEEFMHCTYVPGRCHLG